MYSELDKCPICGSQEFLKISGKRICKVCGAIIEGEMSIMYVSYRNLNREIIFLSPRMKKYIKILNEIQDFLNIPEHIIVKTKKVLYAFLRRYRGRTHPYVTVSTLLVYTSREEGYMVTYHDLEIFFRNKYGYTLNKDKIIKMIGILKRYGIIDRYSNPDYLISTNIYLTRLINELNIYSKDESYYEKMWSIVTNLSEELRPYFQGKNPRTIAAVLIYLSEMWLSKMEGRRTYFTQKMLSKFLGISRFTLRERIRELYSYKGKYIELVISYIKRRN